MRSFLCVCLPLALIVIITTNTHALTFNTVASGNFSNKTTWADGLVPPVIHNVTDTIVINSGDTVALDQHLFIYPNQWLFKVDGTLTTNPGNFIFIFGIGTFQVSGSCNLDSLHLNFGIIADISGQMTVNILHNGIQSYVNGTGDFNIARRVHLYSGISTSNGGNVNILDNATIYMRGGAFATGFQGGPINMAPLVYDVVYTGNAYKRNTSIELTGAGLRNVLIDIDDTANLKLGADMSMTNAGILTLRRGSLMLNNHKLKFLMNSTLAATGTGRIKSTPSSEIIVNNKGLSGPLRFTPGDSLGRLVQNTTTVAVTRLATNLYITKSVNIDSGKIEVMDTCTLSLGKGAVMTGADANNYIITTGKGSVSACIDSSETFTYPIGTTLNYAPCKVTANNNTFSNGLNARINMGVKKKGTTGNNLEITTSVVAATWFLQNDTATNVDFDIELTWTNGMEANNFNRKMAYITQFRVTHWDSTATMPATRNPWGTYYTKRSGITGLGPFSVFDNNTVDIKNLVTQQNIIYPNPATSELYVDIDQPTQATIRNTAGRIMIKADINQTANILNVALLPPGVYFIQLAGNSVKGMAKFIKQ